MCDEWPQAEIMRMLRLDPTPPGREEETPMFRRNDNSAYTTDYVREIVRLLMSAIGENALEFGAHSLRSGW